MRTRAALFSFAVLILAALGASAPRSAAAQEAYPARPVRLVVPFPVGTPPDIIARIASQKLAELWGVPVIVEVRDGAGGTIGISQVVRSAPDGYSLLFTNDFPLVITPAVVAKAPFDARKDLAPIAMLAQGVSVLVVNPSVGVKTTAELIALAKTKPGVLTYGSSGDASTSRMCMELIKQDTGVDLVHVPYKGASAAVQALLAGEVSMYCSPVAQALPHIRSGKVLALGITDTEPSVLLPGVLPLSGQGLPDAVARLWYAALAPAGTPSPVLGRIAESLKRIFDDDTVRQKLSGMGLDPVWKDAGALSETIRSDLEKWKAVSQRAGIRLE